MNWICRIAFHSQEEKNKSEKQDLLDEDCYEVTKKVFAKMAEPFEIP